MELIGSCELMGYTVEAYFPEPGMEDIWTIWVVRDGHVVGEFTTRVEITSAYGVDVHALAQLDACANSALEAVLRRDQPAPRKAAIPLRAAA